jgi:hypothetical protein
MDPSRPDNNDCAPGRASHHLVFGLVVMAVGLLLTLDNLGIVEARSFWRYWPVILIALGLARMREGVARNGRPAGLGLVVVGTVLLLLELGLLRFRIIWPLVLLGIGASMVWRALRRPVSVNADQGGTGAAGDDRLSAFALWSGIRRATSDPDFRRGEATAIMGGCEINLTNASMKGDEAVFDTFALMGGIEIRVPEEWAVENRGAAFLGGFEDRSRRPLDPRKRLIITGLAIMGGVEVKN